MAGTTTISHLQLMAINDGLKSMPATRDTAEYCLSVARSAYVCGKGTSALHFLVKAAQVLEANNLARRDPKDNDGALVTANQDKIADNHQRAEEVKRITVLALANSPIDWESHNIPALKVENLKS
jgi:hypothetical protein